ncbi:MAG: CehA/McbA family metallohydrolase [Sandaracinus sp.]
MPELVLPQTAERYLREPRLVHGGPGRARLHVIAWHPREEREEHLCIEIGLAPLATLGPATTMAQGSALEALTIDPVDVRVAQGGARDLASEGGETIEVRRVEGISSVVLTRAGVEHRVWSARATAAAPALAVTREGTWVAFHHNLREDTHEPDLTKWIALRFVTRAGEVLEPSATMRDRDRDREGEEQGFEMPSLVARADGSVVVVGRGSHRFYAQALDARGFGERVPLGDGAWGCRGRRVAVLALDETTLLTARREKPGIVLATISLATSGAAALVPAAREPEARPHRDVPRRPPALDPARARGLVTLFGDIHQHSAHSDGCGTADEPYLRARWVYGDDFCALSDHESFLGKRISPGEWALLARTADAHDVPGRFATLHAYEWTGKAFPGPGHKVVYATAPHPIVSRDLEPTGAGLAGRLRGTGAIAVPHHVGWTGADEEAHDPEIQPVWEICSCHGCYLTADHPLGQRGDLRDQMIERVLARGRRFGFIACSDGHGLLRHHGVARKRDPFRTGLTAVLAKERTREAIFEAIRARRCYATSGVPIFLDVDAEGAPMGSVVSRAGEVSVVVRAAAATRIASISLVGERGDAAATHPDALEGTLETRVAAGWWYARVVTTDGEMAWSSPIFVEPLRA